MHIIYHNSRLEITCALAVADELFKYILPFCEVGA